MPEPFRSADVVQLPSARLVAAATTLLTAVANAVTATEAEKRFDQFLHRVEKSAEYAEAGFAAAQALRDLETIEPFEAAYVFEGIYDALADEIEGSDARLQALYKAYADALSENEQAQDQALEGADRRRSELRAEFLRARGEWTLATMLVEQPDAHGLACAEGVISLVEGKLSPDNGIPAQPNRRTTALISERIAALAATETGSETNQQWHALIDALRDDDPASGVAAVRMMRDIGVLSFDESLGLVADMVAGLALNTIDADRECVRWERQMAAIKKASGVVEYESFASGSEPFEWQALAARREHRCDRITVVCLRRFGEHRMANLLIENPEEYYRIEAEASIGAWGVRGKE